MEIVVGIDGSPAAQQALAWAADEARLRGSALRIVMAWDYPAYAYTGLVNAPPEEALEAAAQAAFDEAVAEATSAVDLSGLTVNTQLMHGTAASALLDASESAELLVVGTRGRGGFAGMLLGSVSRAVSSHASCPVVVVPVRD